MKAVTGISSEKSLNILYGSFFVLTIITVVFIRVRLLGIPLERDEGEYAYMGQLISHGVIPYKEAYSMKLPGTAFMYSVIMSVFGRGIVGIHLGLMAVNLAVLPALFLLSERLFNERAALVASVSYAAISLGVPVLGFMAHATHFVTFFAVWGLYFLYVAIEDKKRWLIAASGLCLGMAFLMKQHGIFFILFAVTYLFFMRSRLKDFIINGLILMVMSAVPFAIAVFIIYRGGAFNNFWFWCFTYSGKYVSRLSLMDGLLRFKIMALRTAGHFTVFWVFGVIGFFILIYKQRQKGRLFILLFFLFSFLSLSAGFYFREHYFVLMIPAISITAAYFTELLSSALAMKPWGKMLPIVVLLMGMLFTFTVQGKLYFKLPPDEVSREVYGLNPFVESIKIAQYLKGHAQKGDMIAILGSEPQILFYSGIRSVTGYIYMYGLMEDQPFNLQMQHGMTDEIEKNKPAFIVFVKIPASWLPAPNAPLYIFDWATNYIAENYNLVGVVDLIYYDNIVYKFDAEALNYNPWSKYYVCIYRRKDG
ncbi:ArnT family glycosyltransferase [Candidatus Magnetominusculus dajiuhuensis]|uniref:ArnT family glycosyltransferase n=1 Tax=Candidatus Magnetominusculus dajiuhuensis TaxID=3137712 RepID=UPI003B4386C0